MNRRCVRSCALVLAVAGLAGVCLGVARASRSAAEAKPVAGGNGFKHFFSMNGYLDSVSGGCSPSGNPSLQPGSSNTGVLSGDLWLSNGTLGATAAVGGFDKPTYTGTLYADGTFGVSGADGLQPTLTDAIQGKVESLAASGARSVKLVRGSWTNWYTDTNGSCLLHYTMTSGTVDLTCDNEPKCGLNAPGFGGAGTSASTPKPKKKAKKPKGKTSPLLSMTAKPTKGAGPLRVTFSIDDKARNIRLWILDFADGHRRTGSGIPPRSVAHAYAKAATYKATLTVRIGMNVILYAAATVTVTAPSGGTAYHCAGPVTLLFDNWNGQGVAGGGTPPSFDTGGKTYCVTMIATYHFNGGSGAPAGTLGLSGTGTSVGPWQAVGTAGQGGLPNLNWVATAPAAAPPPVIDGAYTCTDSDPATWSQNAGSSGAGFCRVWVQAAAPGA